MADWLGKLLDPYQTVPSFIRFPSSDTLAPAPLPLTHHRQQVHLLVWCDLPGEARTGPIFKCPKIVNFVVLTYRRNQRPHRSIKTGSNDTKSNMKQLLELIYTGVRLGIMFSLSLMAAMLISAIHHHLCVCLFDVPLLLLLPPSALALQGGALLAAGRIAVAADQLIPIVVVLATVIDAPLLLPPPVRWWSPHHPSPDASLTS
jgi:hypothetical protein